MAVYTTIDDPSVHFQCDKYTAGSGTDTVTFDGNSNLKPDLIWVKSMDTAYNHQFHDSTRGATAGAWYTHLSDGEDSTYHVYNFLTDGYINDSVNTAIHANTENIMSYGWKANGGTTTSATTTGGIDSATRQVDSTSKFSIVGYTCESTQAAGTIEHGLGVAPEFMIVKHRTASESAIIYHHKNTTAPETDYLTFSSNATGDASAFWNDTAPTSTVFTLGASNNTNAGGGATYIAYLWASVQGYSKFGTYEGNGNANGTFIYTGFKSAWVLLKNTASTEHWILYDTKRNPGNVTNSKLSPSANNTAPNGAPGLGDTAYNMIDIYSNGFKIRSNNAASSEADATFIYAAFAEEPLVTSGGVPATAR